MKIDKRGFLKLLGAGAALPALPALPVLAVPKAVDMAAIVFSPRVARLAVYNNDGANLIECMDISLEEAADILEKLDENWSAIEEIYRRIKSEGGTDHGKEKEGRETQSLVRQGTD